MPGKKAVQPKGVVVFLGDKSKQFLWDTGISPEAFVLSAIDEALEDIARSRYFTAKFIERCRKIDNPSKPVGVNFGGLE